MSTDPAALATPVDRLKALNTLRGLFKNSLTHCVQQVQQILLRQTDEEEDRIIKLIDEHPLPYQALFSANSTTIASQETGKPDFSEKNTKIFRSLSRKSFLVLEKMLNDIEGRINDDAFTYNEKFNSFLFSDKFEPIERINGLYFEFQYVSIAEKAGIQIVF